MKRYVGVQHGYGYACGVLSCFVGATREFTWDFRHCGVVGLASSVVRDLAGFA